MCALNPTNGKRQIGSVGLRFPYLEMKPVIVEKGQVIRNCGVGEVGLILVRGVSVSAGTIRGNHDESEWIDTSDDKGSWFNTGREGHVDGDGFFWLLKSQDPEEARTESEDMEDESD